MRQSREMEPDDFDYIPGEESLVDDQTLEAMAKPRVRRSIEEYFEKKEIDRLDDWFDDL